VATVGGDAPALFGFANQLRRRRQSIEATAARLGALAEQANWVGPDREAFVSEWRSRHAPALQSVCGDLDAAADRISRAAAAQRDASA
jgi:hypothetical protein